MIHNLKVSGAPPCKVARIE